MIITLSSHLFPELITAVPRCHKLDDLNIEFELPFVSLLLSLGLPGNPAILIHTLMNTYHCGVKDLT